MPLGTKILQDGGLRITCALLTIAVGTALVLGASALSHFAQNNIPHYRRFRWLERQMGTLGKAVSGDAAVARLTVFWKICGVLWIMSGVGLLFR